MKSNNHKEVLVKELQPSIHLISYRLKPSCNVFVIQGTHKNILIDTGIPDGFAELKAGLVEIGLQCKDINMILLTHEHIDHIGCVSNFPKSTLIAAHKNAAKKIGLHDEFVIMSQEFEEHIKAIHIDLHLGNDTLIDVGGMSFRILHTPGHFSGSICLYERSRQILFSGDTVFANGTLGGIFMSGNISDYIDSLENLRDLNIAHLYPAPCSAILMHLEFLNRYSRVHPSIHGKPLSRWNYRRGSMAGSK